MINHYGHGDTKVQVMDIWDRIKGEEQIDLDQPKYQALLGKIVQQVLICVQQLKLMVHYGHGDIIMQDN